MLLIAVLLASGTACGDPVIVLGDSPGELRIVAGIPGVTGDHLGKTATDSELAGPRALAAAGDSLLYFTDPGSGRILALHITGALEVLLDHNPCPGTRMVCLERPAGLAIDPRGRLIVSDESGHRIWRIDPASGIARIIAGTGEEASAPDGALASESPVDSPSGVAVATDGRIFFSERSSHVVRVIRPDGVLGTVAGTGTRGLGAKDVLATESALNGPAGLAFANGTLYLTDRGNSRVRSVDLTSGIITNIVGTGTRGFGGDGGQAAEAQLSSPADIAFAPAGDRLFIADSGNHRIRVVNLRTGVITTFAGTGDTALTGNLRAAGETALFDPLGVAVSSSGMLYIADTGHRVIRRTSVVF